MSIRKWIFAKQPFGESTTRSHTTVAVCEIDAKDGFDIVVGDKDGTVKIWKQYDNQLYWILDELTDGISVDAFSTPACDQNGHLYVGDQHGHIRVFGFDGTRIHDGSFAAIQTVGFSKPAAGLGYFVIGDADGRVRSWDLGSLWDAVPPETAELGLFSHVNMHSMAAPVFDDINHDGFVDLVVTNESGHVQSWLNAGDDSNFTTLWDPHPLNVLLDTTNKGNATIAIENVDNFDRTDILIGTQDGNLEIWFWDLVTAAPSSSYTVAPVSPPIQPPVQPPVQPPTQPPVQQPSTTSAPTRYPSVTPVAYPTVRPSKAALISIYDDPEILDSIRMRSYSTYDSYWMVPAFIFTCIFLFIAVIVCVREKLRKYQGRYDRISNQ